MSKVLALSFPVAAWSMSATPKASKPARLSTNAPGPLFVDSSCIDCDTCRWMAPELFGRASGQSFARAQPEDEASWLAAQRAAVACPTGSIRSEEARKEARAARDSFPAALPGIDGVVCHAGYHSPKSFGATPYVAETASGELFMVDSPRYSSALANAIEEKFKKAPSFLLLTHVDDVGDHDKWKERFPDLKRVIHEHEVRGPNEWPYIETRNCEEILTGTGDWSLAEGVTAVHVPGHSRGHLAFLFDDSKVLFTGDHLAYSGRLDRVDGFARFGWDVTVQADSIAKLQDRNFLHVLPGHGRRVSFADAHDRKTQIAAAAQNFRDDPYGTAHLKAQQAAGKR